MYLAAPVNAFYSPTIWISHAEAEITVDVKAEFFHAANAVHGSVYFKMLDDASFFAVNSLVEDYFVLTSTYTTYLLRPISTGQMKARGRVVHAGRKCFVAESVMLNSDGEEIARGSGNFVVSKIRLTPELGYRV
jgi:uncharacterized protein (TIGR00369 family)